MITRLSWTVFVIGLLVEAAACTVAMGQQLPDKDFKATVDQPAYVDRHPKVLFDEGHFNVHTSQGTYQAFVGLLKSDGYDVTASDKPFDPTMLTGFDILISSNPRGAAQRSEKSAFTERECNIVRDWVQAGGSLLLVVDHYPTGHAAESLAKRFGVELSKGRTTDRANAPAGGGLGGTILFTREKNALGDHAITRGRNESERVNRVATFTGESLQGPPESTSLLILSDAAIDFFPSDAVNTAPGGVRRRRAAAVGSEPQASAAGKSQGVAFQFGKGRVVVLGEASQLSAQRAGPQQRAMGMNYEGCDNRQWAINIAHWLSGLIE